MQVEHGTFTSLVMSATGEAGRESSKFYSRLSELISENTVKYCDMHKAKNYISSDEIHWHVHQVFIEEKPRK